ncbi:MAG: acetyl-CoA carboxylase biotin carboxyl carrier protein [Ignavibacteriae bacterium HGW-Ignavibacteriae-1]|jgi:acetyl-CoA carboxylase biotin carboxyl carrier protein|nr:MAG: acetyl-CoA carboxylase biotin carboxyl carrier protein [Ignavibacteriae bacterium HGW-Ignavibacteriae-1]
MDISYLKDIMQLFDESSASSLEIDEEGTKIKISKISESKSESNSNQPIIIPMGSFASAPNMVAQESQHHAPQPAAPVAEVKEVAPKSNLHEIKSPIVGTFYRSPSPESPAFVEVGTKIRPGDTLCIIEAMKLMNEIESDISGTVVEILIENSKPIEFNQPIFLIKPD